VRFAVTFEVVVADPAQLDELEREVRRFDGVAVLRADRESLDPVEPRVVDRLDEARLIAPRYSLLRVSEIEVRARAGCGLCCHEPDVGLSSIDDKRPGDYEGYDRAADFGGEEPF